MYKEYFIKKISDLEYNIAKFLDGEYIQSYIVSKKINSWKCNCPSGTNRNYCKHKDWIGIIIKNKTLPVNVKKEEDINLEEIL